MTRRRRSGVRLDVAKVNRELLRLGLTRTQFADDVAELDRRTVAKAFEGKPVSISSAVEIAVKLGFPSVLELTAPAPEISGNEERITAIGEEWELDTYISDVIRASNGLQFQLCRTRHRFLPQRIGRGKEYNLRNPAMREKERLDDCLTRHASVSERVRGCPEIAENLNVFPARDGKAWWVIDRWVEGVTLDELLKAGPLGISRVVPVMNGILRGLDALHRNEIVFRELAPRHVIMRSDASIVLTDFELGKLLDNAPSVSESKWIDDPYRAPEIEGRQTTAAADLYSWARILTRAACGTLPEPGKDIEAITMAGLPKAVWKAAVDCLAPAPQDRPESAAKVLRQIRNWK